MGFNEAKIILYSPDGSFFYSGQTISGKLTFQQDSVKTFRGIYVKLKGFCKVHWTTSESSTSSDGSSSSQSINHDSYEEYVHDIIYLIGGSLGEVQLGAGYYDFPFTFHLPHNCPSSFEGEYGHVRYTIKAVLDRAFKFNQEKKDIVRVICPLDLNADPYCKEPIQMVLMDTYFCCCIYSGETDTVIKVPVSGFCIGQAMPIDIACKNKGSVAIDLKFIILKKTTFIAKRRSDKRHQKETISKHIVPVPADTTLNCIEGVKIPGINVCNMACCQYIRVEYKLKVVVCPSGCYGNYDASRKIIIGTIPLVGYQGNVQNSLPNHMPQLAAVTQQPLPQVSPSHSAAYAPHPGNTYASDHAGKTAFCPMSDIKPPLLKGNTYNSDNPPPYPG